MSHGKMVALVTFLWASISGAASPIVRAAESEAALFSAPPFAVAPRAQGRAAVQGPMDSRGLALGTRRLQLHLPDLSEVELQMIALERRGPEDVGSRGRVAGNANSRVTLTLKHGHNLGLEHNPENSAVGSDPDAASYPWSFGRYVDGSFRTVMSYADPCGSGCSRITHFSNPSINHNGMPTGIDGGRDNARTGNLTTPIVADFRPTVVTGSTVFAAIGDFGSDSVHEADVAAVVAGWNADFVVTVGDNRYGNIDFDVAVGKYYCDFLTDVQAGSNCPGGNSLSNAFFPATGNHDYTDGGGINEYLSYFTLPGTEIQTSGTSGSELYYDFVQGPVHFFAVDSQAALGSGSSMSAQQSWLQQQMGASTARWQVVLLHHAPYSSSSSHGSTGAMQWPFATWGADAVIAGHDHTYERLDIDGIPYFVNGLGGRSIYGFGSPIAGSMVRYNGDYGAMRIHATDSEMTFEFINTLNTIVDTHAIQDGDATTVTAQISSGIDDVEERHSDGVVDLDSTDMELGNDPGFNGDQTVGLRFNNLDIPLGATITSAHLEFFVDEIGSTATNVTISAEATDNAPVFSAAVNNVTNRVLTAAWTDWSIPAWNTVGAFVQSPDMSAVVQEVVDRSGWVPNNSMAFIIDGTGERTAEAYEGSAAQAARLHIEYDSAMSPPSPDPMSWLVPPYQDGSWPGYIVGTMTATTATDSDGGIEYYFDCVEAPAGDYWNGCEDSGWQTSSTFSDWHLVPGNTYHYQVKARDALGNETAWSPQAAIHIPGGGGQNEIMTWVPPYAISQCQTVANADFGTCDAKDALTRVGLQFWIPNADGTIQYHPTFQPDDADVAWWTNWGQANGIKILLTIYNNDGSWNWPLARSAFADNRATFVSALVSEMDRLNLDGIDIDLEGIGDHESDRSGFDQFIHDLWLELDARDKILTVDTFSYIWNAPNQNWWSDWVGEVDHIHSMGYDELYEGGTTWHKYSYQQNAAYAAGYPGNAVLMGLPSWLSSWGTSSGRGTSAQAHVQEVRYDLAEPTGIAIWDLQLSQWQDSDLWCEIKGLKEAGSTNNPPAASFTYSTTDLTANFIDTSTDSDGSITSWSWDFGDGNTSSAQNPSHSYASAGTYPVSLAVTDNQGATDVDSQNVTVTSGSAVNHQIKLDHFGYRPADTKVAIFTADPGSTVEIRDLSDTVVYAIPADGGFIQYKGTDGPASGDEVWWVDFSAFTTAGSYRVHSPALSDQSYDFEIREDIYNDVVRAAMRSFYLQRCNTPKETPFAGQWDDLAACHMTDSSTGPATGHTNHGSLDLTGGWHDAGDYNKYIWTDLSTAVLNMLRAFEDNPGVFPDGDLNIPESGNGIPDLLDELKWELDWMLKMQLGDGSVLHQMHTDGWDWDSPPSADTNLRYYQDANIESGSVFSGTLAHASRVFAAHGMTAYANTLKSAALDAWAWLQIQGDSDEKVWAAAEIFATDSSVTSARDYVDNYYADWSTQFVHPLNYDTHAVITYIQAPGATAAVVTAMRNAVNAQVDYIFSNDDYYRNGMVDWAYHWGSNKVRASYGIFLHQAIKLGETGSHTVAEMDEHAQDFLHFFHGQNPINMVYLTNMAAHGGEHCLWQIYHGWFGASGNPYSAANHLGKPAGITEPDYPYFKGTDNHGVSDNNSSLLGPAPGIVPGGPNKNYSGTSIPPSGAVYHNLFYRDWADQSTSSAVTWEISENSISYQGTYVALGAYYMDVDSPPGCSTGADCDDGNVCTDDVCTAGVCSNPNNTVPCDDGVFCNGSDTCSAGSCSLHAGDPCAGEAECSNTCNEAAGDCLVPAGTVCTDDGNVCTDNECDGAGNCVAINNSASCEDGLFCNGSEVCVAGACQAGSPVNCDDGVGCTDDSCNESTDACDNVANDGNCDDGTYCNGAETCDVLGDCLMGGEPCPGQLCDESGETCVDCFVDGDCDDGAFCNGMEACIAGTCQGGGDPCPGEECDEVNDVCVPIVCDNDGTCESGEDCDNCPNDCISGSGASCGNGVCEPGEDCLTCSQDCNGKQNGRPSRRFCCSGDAGGGGGQNPVDCADAQCTSGGFECSSTADAYCCGDGFCEGSEDDVSCALDCAIGCSVPAHCDDFVACTDDDCVGGMCTFTPNDANCADDGLFCNGTEFCDALADCSSTGDPCSTGTVCNESTDTCDQQACGGNGAACNANTDCCSNKCKNGTCRGN